MTDPRWQRLWELFHAAAEMTATERASFLDSACEGDEEVRAEVERLLASHDRGDGALDESAGRPVLSADDLLDPLLGDRIGPYRIVEVLGEGGMGVVYAAEQEEPVRRRVALKVIRVGMDTREVVARFAAERQALAMMDHPGVARVYDAGATEEGRPYFAMELVDGVPITEYCDTERLDTRQRLDLLIQVCAGVRHAHQRGIIHRDLKPSNVLVGTVDGSPAPKIIDFGVAKATNRSLTERSMFTAFGAWIGTPEYMSPEQAAMTESGVDTRTDVYSLGVLLYEVLVGALPFDARDLREAAFDEVRRRIREEEPPKPSTRVSSLGGDVVLQKAALRRTDPESLRRQLSGDLDWIAMKALSKEPDRRYDSASELAADLERHLRHEPVLAGPPGGFYRARKFFRRHAVGAGFATLAVLFVSALAIVMTVQASRVARERDLAAVEAETSKQVSDFLVGIFEVSDPSEARGNEVTARQVLDKGAAEIGQGLGDQPEVRARLLHAIGEVYRGLGLYEEAQPLLEEALEIRRRELGDQDPETLAVLDRLGALAYDREDYERAESFHREALSGRRQVLGDDSPETASSLNNLGVVLKDSGRPEEAESLLEDAVRIRQSVLGAEHEETLVALGNLAQLRRSQGRLDAAAQLTRQVLEARRRVLGDDHPDTLISLVDLGFLLKSSGQLAEAEPLLEEAVETSRRVLGGDHRETLTALGNLGDLRGRQGRFDEALAIALEVWQTRRRTLGAEAAITLIDLNQVGVAYFRAGDFVEAERYWRQTLEASRRVRSADHPETLSTLGNLAVALRRQGRLVEAEPLLRESLERKSRVLGAEHPSTMLAMANLGHALATLERFADAEELLSTASETARRVLPERHVLRADLAGRYGDFLRARGRYGEAEPLLLESFEIAVLTEGERGARAGRFAGQLVELYDDWTRPKEAAEWRSRLSGEEP